jgi:hypothetical protein
MGSGEETGSQVWVMTKQGKTQPHAACEALKKEEKMEKVAEKKVDALELDAQAMEVEKIRIMLEHLMEQVSPVDKGEWPDGEFIMLLLVESRNKAEKVKARLSEITRALLNAGKTEG